MFFVPSSSSVSFPQRVPLAILISPVPNRVYNPGGRDEEADQRQATSKHCTPGVTEAAKATADDFGVISRLINGTLRHDYLNNVKATSAAACSASRLLLPTPVPTTSLSITTSTTKVRSCGKPCSSATR